MRKLLALLAVTAGLLVGLAVPASASSSLPLPNPSDCHSMNAFLHIDNVRDCDNNG